MIQLSFDQTLLHMLSESPSFLHVTSPRSTESSYRGFTPLQPGRAALEHAANGDKERVESAGCSRSGYSRLYNTTHAGGCTALSLPSISFSLAHIGLALFQIMALTKDEEVLIVERRDDEE